MPFAILPLLQWIGNGFWTFASSRMGQILITFIVAWLWSGWRTEDYWKSIIASEKAKLEAAYKAEVARQAKASVEIAEAATARAEEDASVADELRRQIEAFNNQESKDVQPNKQTIILQKGKSNPCVIDDDFSRVLRKFDDAGSRKAKPSRSTK